MNAHLVLVGLSGSGKSTVGRIVASRLGRPFLDMDGEVERREEKSIVQIFAEEGERYFRTLEAEVTEELRHADASVIATGGGWITNPKLVALVRPPSRLVYLRVRPETAIQRLRGSPVVRPLLAGADPLEALRKQHSMRHVMYQSADHEINTESLAPADAADVIVAMLGDVRAAGVPTRQ